MSPEAEKVASWLRLEAIGRYNRSPDIAVALERAAQGIEAGEHLLDLFESSKSYDCVRVTDDRWLRDGKPLEMWRWVPKGGDNDSDGD